MVGMGFEIPGPRNIRNGPEDDCLGEKESGREESGGEDPEGSSGPGVDQRKLDRTEKAEKDPVGSEGEALWTPGYGLQEQDRKTQHHGKNPCVHPDSQRAIRKASNQEVRRVKDGLGLNGQGLEHDKGESDQDNGRDQEAPVFSRGQPLDRACIHESNCTQAGPDCRGNRASSTRSLQAHSIGGSLAECSGDILLWFEA